MYGAAECLLCMTLVCFIHSFQLQVYSHMCSSPDTSLHYTCTGNAHPRVPGLNVKYSFGSQKFECISHTLVCVFVSNRSMCSPSSTTIRPNATDLMLSYCVVQRTTVRSGATCLGLD